MTDRAAIRRDIHTLVQADPRLGPGRGVPIEVLDPGFAGMIQVILGQQVSIEAADAMYKGLKRRGAVTPETILGLDDESLRAHGFTRMKASYARRLAVEVLDGFDLDAVAALGTDDAVAALTRLHGVGRWTAECFLLFCAGHRDVFPASDLALRVGWQEIASLDAPPHEGDLREIALQWVPRRTAAAHLIWHRYLTARGRR